MKLLNHKKLSSTFPLDIKTDALNCCIHKNHNLQYSIPNALGVGELIMVLPKGFSDHINKPEIPLKNELSEEAKITVVEYFLKL